MCARVCVQQRASDPRCLPKETERVSSCNLDPYTDEKERERGREKLNMRGRDNVIGGRVGGGGGGGEGGHHTDREREKEG